MSLAYALPITAVIALLIVAIRGRRLLFAELLQIIGQVPAKPAAGLQWLFIGRFDPPDPDPRRAPAVYVDDRPGPQLPIGVKRIEKSEEPDALN